MALAVELLDAVVAGVEHKDRAGEINGHVHRLAELSIPIPD